MKLYYGKLKVGDLVIGTSDVLVVVAISRRPFSMVRLIVTGSLNDEVKNGLAITMRGSDLIGSCGVPETAVLQEQREHAYDNA